MKRARSIRLQPKLLLGLVAMAAVLAAILAPSIAQLYRARMEEQYASLAFGQASVAADLIDGDRVEQYYRTGEKDALLRGDPPLPAGRQGEAGVEILLCGRAGG